MNKIEQLHSDAIKQSIQWVDWNLADRQINETASKSAEITEQIAIEFLKWSYLSEEAQEYKGNLVFSEIDVDKMAKELFQKFIKTKQ